ncbi:MAG: AAA family ATPase [Chthoniobacter sp.]
MCCSKASRGLGKTELVKTLSRALTLDFRRIQFTPDLMPADIVGTNVMTAGPDGRYNFEFRRGPIFHPTPAGR